MLNSAGKLIYGLCFLLVVCVNNAMAEVIHSERSLYRNILVEDNGDLRCLKFNVKSTKTRQSCLLKSQPQQLVFNYTKQLLTGLLVNPEPKHILIIGLGGGTMSNTLHQLLPDSYIDNVEIDESVIKVARQYFGFLENDQIKTYSQDGRVFVKRALLKKQEYDWIILDAFNGDYIPEHLMTKEYLEETKRLLSPQGILTANTFSSSQLYRYESATYKAVFGDYYQVSNPDNSNRIILARNSGLDENLYKELAAAEQSESITQLAIKLLAIGVEVKQLYKNIKSTATHQDWPDDSPVLTDQFSPANLLNIDVD
ncbi:spermidine synthase [Colwellia psychrerythraea]|uniref:Spermine/spermidine synthase family protein n=1 Tax=Colwellia psychrerythraea (strain 34H / ATCC BAA-681) TaxID=167879 RepID=Q47W52_COLP3|nr:fused MFS/spermidine synthase [Colwellia psychrerythraea]AAZ24952.1 spermine/spermidine synthase family protein [Colwellia psychrerythraea 34H]